MVQIFQRGSKIFSKISSGGSLFIKKLVPGGTTFGGSIFTMTVPIEGPSIPCRETLACLQGGASGQDLPTPYVRTVEGYPQTAILHSSQCYFSVRPGMVAHVPGILEWSLLAYRH